MTKNKQPFTDPGFRFGILGGGQLGKMLCQKTAQWSIHTSVLDTSSSFPAGSVCTEFTEGNFKDFDTVCAFGKDLDVVTIEIESVNSRALHYLAENGVVVHPDPRALDIIKDKGLQKQFYADHDLPTAPFHLFEDKGRLIQAVQDGEIALPFVIKARRGGYDGRSVLIARTEEDLRNAFDGPLLVEPEVSIDKEVSVVVARSEAGDVKAFPPVGMAFHPTANLVEYLFCPSGLGPDIEKKATSIACAAIEQYGIQGLLAVEMFFTKDGELLINEVAPRPHNSGHHTIEACNVSQFEQHLRAILGLPLAQIELRKPAVMVNLLGEPGHQGAVRYTGVDRIMDLADIHLHIYGKAETRPHRKLGHITVLGDSLEQAVERAKFVTQHIQATT